MEIVGFLLSPLCPCEGEWGGLFWFDYQVKISIFLSIHWLPSVQLKGCEDSNSVSRFLECLETKGTPNLNLVFYFNVNKS